MSKTCIISSLFSCIVNTPMSFNNSCLFAHSLKCFLGQSFKLLSSGLSFWLHYIRHVMPLCQVCIQKKQRESYGEDQWLENVYLEGLPTKLFLSSFFLSYKGCRFILLITLFYFSKYTRKYYFVWAKNFLWSPSGHPKWLLTHREWSSGWICGK